MEWIVDLFSNHESIAYTVLVYSIVIALGVFLGRLKFFGISFGIAFVLFAGIAVSHFGFTINPEILHFVKEFGLILFVYTIGLQVGPGFFASLEKEGLKLNFISIITIVTCVITVLAIFYITKEDIVVLTGVMSGAVTNTPGLGAAQQTIMDLTNGNPDNKISTLGTAYAMSYPFGVLGIIIVMLLFKSILRVNVEAESRLNKWKTIAKAGTFSRRAIKVINPQLFGKKEGDIYEVLGDHLVISRLSRKGKILRANPETILEADDVLLIVAAPDDFRKIENFVGKEDFETDLGLDNPGNSPIVSKRISVTKKAAYAKKIGQSDIFNAYPITVTRYIRAGLEFIATPSTKLQFGDTIIVIGEEKDIEKFAKAVGNSKKEMSTPHIAELFFGIILGVLLGSIPFHIPGVPLPVKLGLAGGPLVVAILISRYGGKFSVTHYVSQSANLMVREIGIVLFLASVGLGAGENFVETIVNGDGLYWMLLGVIITLVPLIVTSIVCRSIYKLSYPEICGILAGVSTDPPALAFANQSTGSDAPAVSYATVYPLTTFLRIMVAQFLILFFYT
ncbi:putative transporter [Ornithobacterium rhinotracheale]|uniref:putative transporter n=1 Tax=Ornithobacterium rhinotracheale TaxID=28251 RepID=UPI004035F817